MNTASEKPDELANLPASAAEFIQRIVKRMGYTKRARRDVRTELADHFEQALKGAADKTERQQRAQELIAQFGSVEQLARLLRRAKKRCRPLWETIIVRTLQAVGLLLLLFVLYTVWFLSGEPSVRTDYVAMLNDMSKPDILVEDNAWPHYERAVELLTEPPRVERKAPHEVNEPELEQIKAWIAANEAAWSEYAAGSAKAYCYRPYRFDPNSLPVEQSLLNLPLPPLSSIKKLARMGAWRARLAMLDGRIDNAIEDTLVVARSAAHWQGDGTLVEQLVGTAISALSQEQLIDIIAAADLTPDRVEQLRQSYAAVYPDGYPLVNVESERLVFLDLVQRVFSEGGPGGGHLLPRVWTDLGAAPTGLEEEELILAPLYTAGSMVHARRNKTLARFREIFDYAVRVGRMTPYQRHIEQLDINRELMRLPKYRYFLIPIMMPPLGRANDLALQRRACYQVVQMILALKQWRFEKGQYPVSADALVKADYLENLPGDPYSDGPVVYRRTDKGFTLYSVGPDFTDDGGKPSLDRKGRVRKWQEGGDTVFWPVAAAPAE